MIKVGTHPDHLRGAELVTLARELSQSVSDTARSLARRMQALALMKGDASPDVSGLGIDAADEKGGLQVTGLRPDGSVTLSDGSVLESAAEPLAYMQTAARICASVYPIQDADKFYTDRMVVKRKWFDGRAPLGTDLASDEDMRAFAQEMEARMTEEFGVPMMDSWWTVFDYKEITAGIAYTAFNQMNRRFAELLETLGPKHNVVTRTWWHDAMNPVRQQTAEESPSEQLYSVVCTVCNRSLEEMRGGTEGLYRSYDDARAHMARLLNEHKSGCDLIQVSRNEAYMERGVIAIRITVEPLRPQ